MNSINDIVRRLRENRILNERQDYSKMSRTELIKLAQDGDQLAVDILLKSHKDFIRKMTYKYFDLGSGYDRDDVEQLGNIAFWDALMKWNFKGDFEAFAGMIIKHKMTDEMRKSDANSRYANERTASIDSLGGDETDDRPTGDMSSEEYSSYVTQSHTSAEEDYIGNAGAERIMKWMKDNLSENERKAIRLYIEGYKVSEIPEKTGMKYKAVENAIMRVKWKLKDYLQNTNESKEINESAEDGIDLSDEERQILKNAFQMTEAKEVQSNSAKVRNLLNDLGIEYETISEEEDGTVDVTNSTPYSHSNLKTIYDRLPDATGTGFSHRNYTMWFSFD